jgi:hypothetical protein
MAMLERSIEGERNLKDMPDRRDIPASCNCGFADTGSQESISTGHNNAFLHIFRHYD